MPPKKITDFLNVKEDVTLVQGYVPRELRERTVKQIKADKELGISINWDKLISAALMSYLEERKQASK